MWQDPELPGLRPAKCIGDSFPDGIRLPLFGQDSNNHCNKISTAIATAVGDLEWLH